MTNTRKLIGAAAFSVALAGGGIAGALLGTPVTSGAQEESTTTTATPADDEARPGGGPRGERLEAAATALGMTADELEAELQAGNTIAEVAAAEGVDVETVIDAIVADATDELRERVTAFVNGEAPLGGPRPGRNGGPRLDAAAAALGITEDELKAALQDGQSIAQIAEANGIDVQTVIDALVAEASAYLDEEVAEGDLTQEEADAKKAELETRITGLVNREGGFRRGPGGHGPRP